VNSEISSRHDASIITKVTEINVDPSMMRSTGDRSFQVILPAPVTSGVGSSPRDDPLMQDLDNDLATAGSAALLRNARSAREPLNEHVIPLWLEQLVRPKPSGPDPFPLRKPLKEKPKPILDDDQEQARLDQEAIFERPQEEFFQKARENDFMLKLCALFPHGPTNETSKHTEAMVLSKFNYQKMTKLIIGEIQEEIRLTNFKPEERVAETDTRLSTYDVNEMIPLPDKLRTIPPFLKIKLSLLATMHTLENDQVKQLQNSVTNSIENSPRVNESRKSYRVHVDMTGEQVQSHVQENDVNIDHSKISREATSVSISSKTPTTERASSHGLYREISNVGEDRPISAIDILREKSPLSASTRYNPPFDAGFSLEAESQDLPSKSDLFILYSLLTQKGQIISLRAHFISMLPNTLVAIAQNLVYLNLSFNRFTEVPIEFFENCSQLEVLKLRNNPLEELTLAPEMKNLRVLIVSFCKLKTSPKNMEQLDALEKVDLSYNLITELPGNLSYLCGTLEEMDMSGNAIRCFPSDMLKLNLQKFTYDHNFTKPIFWQSTQESNPKSLQSVCHTVLENNKTEVPNDIRKQMNTAKYTCETCGRTAFGESMKVIRPCKNLWGLKYVPFMFECCSVQGRRELIAKREIEC